MCVLLHPHVIEDEVMIDSCILGLQGKVGMRYFVDTPSFRSHAMQERFLVEFVLLLYTILPLGGLSQYCGWMKPREEEAGNVLVVVEKCLHTLLVAAFVGMLI